MKLLVTLEVEVSPTGHVLPMDAHAILDSVAEAIQDCLNHGATNGYNHRFENEISLKVLVATVEPALGRSDEDD